MVRDVKFSVFLQVHESATVSNV